MRFSCVPVFLQGFRAAVAVPEFHFEDELLLQLVYHQVYLSIVAGFGFKVIETCTVD